MNPYQLASYRQRSASEIDQVRAGFVIGLALALGLWLMVAPMLFPVLR